MPLKRWQMVYNQPYQFHIVLCGVAALLRGEFFRVFALCTFVLSVSPMVDGYALDNLRCQRLDVGVAVQPLAHSPQTEECFLHEIFGFNISTLQRCCYTEQSAAQVHHHLVECFYFHRFSIGKRTSRRFVTFGCKKIRFSSVFCSFIVLKTVFIVLKNKYLPLVVSQVRRGNNGVTLCSKLNFRLADECANVGLTHTALLVFSRALLLVFTRQKYKILLNYSCPKYFYFVKIILTENGNFVLALRKRVHRIIALVCLHYHIK